MVGRHLFGLISLATILFFSCGFFAEEDDELLPQLPEPPKVARSITYPVERDDMYEAIEGTAKAMPVERQTLYFLVSGRIQSIEVDPEDEVAAGTLLAKLEIDNLEHQLALAEIDRDIARANLDRMKATSATESEVRIQELVVAKHDLNVFYLEKRIEAASIRAPFDGIIQHRLYIMQCQFLNCRQTILNGLSTTEVAVDCRLNDPTNGKANADGQSCQPPSGHDKNPVGYGLEQYEGFPQFTARFYPECNFRVVERNHRYVLNQKQNNTAKL